MKNFVNTQDTNIAIIFNKFTAHVEGYHGALFMDYYGTPGICYRITIGDDGEPVYKEALDGIDRSKIFRLDCINERVFIQKYIESDLYNKKLFIAQYSNDEYLLYGDMNCVDFPKFMIYIAIGDDPENDGSRYMFVWTDDMETLFPIIKEFIVKFKKNEKLSFGIAAIDQSNCLYTAYYDYDLGIDFDINKNYNDDLPINKIYSIIENQNKPDLMLFYGEPGTGKSTLIKHLIGKYRDRDFIFIDGNIIEHAQHEKLMSYFIENHEAVFVFEDCEKILLDRKTYYNPVMSTLLNISDGIIGDVLCIKMICTFNTDLTKIDSALLRKGRLSLKYEFKKLHAEKCRKILNNENIKEDMSLADIYNYENENDFSKNNTKKIGF